ncbi:MAG: GNVR domain-containing protein [Candidatus Omnitrophica bacterium]|nr:GNVR domain-containing protein [Candidatus Omnitrophota bacterium]
MNDILLVVKKRMVLILVFVAAVSIFEAVRINKIKPMYAVTASLILENMAPKSVTDNDMFYAPNDLGVDYYRTQCRILSSRFLAEKVFNMLHLDNDVEFKDSKDPVGLLLSKVSVEQERYSWAVFVHVYDNNPKRAALIANAIVDAYIIQDVERKLLLKQNNKPTFSLPIEQLKEMSMEKMSIISGIRILDKAVVPNSPVFPNRIKSIMLAIIISAFAGVVISYAFEIFSPSLKKVKKAKLQ